MIQMSRVKVTLFGGRHTGQGPISRAWGRTTADLPALQPVCVYEREVNAKGRPAIVSAWVLSLDPQFDYMRTAMYLKTDAFIYTFDLLSQPDRSLEYLEPFITEVQEVLRPMPPQILVGTKADPTLKKPEYISQFVKDWMAKRGIATFFEVDLTDKPAFLQQVEEIFAQILSHVK